MDSQTIILLFAFGVIVFAAMTLVKILTALNQLILLAAGNQKSLDKIKNTLTNDGHSIFGNLHHVAKMTSKTVNHLKGVDDEDNL